MGSPCHIIHRIQKTWKRLTRQSERPDTVVIVVYSHHRQNQAESCQTFLATKHRRKNISHCGPALTDYTFPQSFNHTPCPVCPLPLNLDNLYDWLDQQPVAEVTSEAGLQKCHHFSLVCLALRSRARTKPKLAQAERPRCGCSSRVAS